MIVILQLVSDLAEADLTLRGARLYARVRSRARGYIDARTVHGRFEIHAAPGFDATSWSPWAR